MPDNNDQAAHLVDEANDYFGQGKFKESESAFSRLGELAGHEADAHYGKGVVFYSQNDLGRAESELQEALRLNPRDPTRDTNGCYYLGQIAERTRRPSVAISYYERAIEIYPQNAVALKSLEILRGPRVAPSVDNPLPGSTTDLRIGEPTRLVHPLPQPVHVGPVGSSDRPAPEGFYGLLLQDDSELARQLRSKIDALAMEVRPSVLSFGGYILPRVLLTLLFAILAYGAMRVTAGRGTVKSPSAVSSTTGVGTVKPPGAMRGTTSGDTITFPSAAVRLESRLSRLPQKSPAAASPVSSSVSSPVSSPVQRVWTILTLFLGLGFLGALGFTGMAIARPMCTHYRVGQGRIEITYGVFTRTVRNLELLKIEEIKIHQGIVNKVTGDGTLCLSERGHPPANLTGLATIERLRELLPQFRDLVVLLRSGNWGKGVIY
jgi:hypothetical protein